jgi:hypothetical protein
MDNKRTAHILDFPNSRFGLSARATNAKFPYKFLKINRDISLLGGLSQPMVYPTYDWGNVQYCVLIRIFVLLKEKYPRGGGAV